MLRILQVEKFSSDAWLSGIVKSTLQNLSDVKATEWRLVVLKPNWVQEGRADQPDVWEQVITSPEMVTGIAATVAPLMADGGLVVICDAPHTYANFSNIIARGRLAEALEGLKKQFPKIGFELLDLRREVWDLKDGVVVRRRPNPTDPRGYVRLDLGQNSLFYGHKGEGKYYGADYDVRVVNSHHHGSIQEYLLAGTPMECDLFVNLPKLKTHKKTGMTCSLKNLVGINGDKNWLPHHTRGAIDSGGDEFAQQESAQRIEGRLKWLGQQMALRFPGLGTWLFSQIRKVGVKVLGGSDKKIRNGNWSGNDTCWRMALDLNRALLYGRPDGTWGNRPRPYLCIVDGILAGEGNGPLCPDPVKANVVVIGDNPAEVDAVCCKLMGFDPRQIPIVREAFAPHRWPISSCPMEAVRVFDERKALEIGLDEVESAVAGGFEPHFGWKMLNPGKCIR
jgi:uncharacterized protein (DUF362 family)